VPVGAFPALALLAGAVCGGLVGVPPMAALGVLAVVVTAAVAAYVCDWRRTFVAFAIVAFWWGACALASDARGGALHGPLRGVLDRRFGGFSIDTPGPGGRHDPVRVRGVLLEDASHAEDATALRMRVEEIALDGVTQHVAGDAVFSVSGLQRPGASRRPGAASGDVPPTRRPGAAFGGASADPAPAWVAGRTLAMMATFRRPARYLNEGVPDFERDLALSGTTLFGSVKSGLLVEVVARGSPMQEAAARVRGHVRRALDRWVTPHDPLSAAIAAAVVIGDRTGLPDDIRLRLQAAGTYHVIAISGGNIAILAGLSFGVLFLSGVAGRGAAVATLVLLVGYACVVTAGPSVWRATLMASLYLVARILDHRSAPWQAMAVAASLAVCADPLEVRDPGFVLTFGATAALLEAARRMTGRADGGAAKLPVVGWQVSAPVRWVVASLMASAAAEIVLLPVSATSFWRVTCSGLLLNLAAVPLMAVVQIGATVVALMDGVEPVAFAAGWSTHLAARGIVWSAQLVDLWPWLTRRVPPPPLPLVAFYYASLAAALTVRRRARAWAIAVLAVAGVAIAAGVWPLGASVPAGRLRLTVFDVGQGDASLLEFPDGRRIQVDSGGIPFGSSSFDIGARVLAPALWTRGIRRIDTLLLTHGDPDHIGGAGSLIDDFAPQAIWDGIRVPPHVPMRELRRQAAHAGIRVERRVAGQQLSAGGARIRVLHPPLPDWERPRVRNDDSVVLEVLYGDVAMLLTGDISADIERAILPQLSPAKIRILKVAHHGSRTSTSDELLRAWRPDVALISCGRGNSFGHPAPGVLARIASIGADIYRTDLDGEITLTTDGDRLSVSTFVEPSR
jgi:competence protein ComEC